MKIATRQGYDTAIVSAEMTFTVDMLRRKTARIGQQLKQKKWIPGSPVLIYVASAGDLLAAMWALIYHRSTFVPVNPGSDVAMITTLAQYCGAGAIITEQRYGEFPPTVDTILTDDDIPEETVEAITTDDYDINCIFREGDKMVSFHHDDITAFYQELDMLMTPAERQRIMLAGNIPFTEQTLELLWASVKGITVVMDQLKDQASAAQYIYLKPPFSMDFSLFHFGSYVDNSQQDKYGLLLDAATFADTHGFKAIWTPERHFNEFGGLYPNPSVLSAALATHTRNVQIRCGSLVSPLHHPVRIAEDWALIDNLSNGRVGISFASGWQCDDFIFFPGKYADRHHHMLEQIATVRQLWAGESVPAINGLGNEIQVKIFPRPIQQELPIWITVSGKIETFVDAGRMGANILTHLLWQNTDELIDKIAAYRTALKDSGFDPYSRKVTVMVHTYLGEDDEQVKQQVREPLKNYIRSSTQLIQTMAKSNAAAGNSKEVAGRYGGLNDQIADELLEELTELAFERFFEQAGLLGSAKKAERLLHKLKSYDVDEVACLIDFGLSREDILEGLHRLNNLRTLYAEQPSIPPSISALHCSASLLRMAGEQPWLLACLSAVQHILTDSDELDGTPALLLKKVKVVRADTAGKGNRRVYANNVIDIQSDPDSAFIGALSDEF
ncbi:natural product biosynthesis luciferase-like monooxygenase protein [Chitinophaga sp. W2I13]|uniref:MupA/Atu3671 family FMN-dependent luciferase-like monooxygenase n=1 Tax=Chitinophaga sp. W2I13 TaxID=3373923 RepID=UPI003D1BFCD8